MDQNSSGSDADLYSNESIDRQACEIESGDSRARGQHCSIQNAYCGSHTRVINPNEKNNRTLAIS